MSRVFSFIVSGKSYGNYINRKWEIYMPEMSFIQSGTELAVTGCLALPGSSVMERESFRTFSSCFATILRQ